MGTFSTMAPRRSRSVHRTAEEIRPNVKASGIRTGTMQTHSTASFSGKDCKLSCILRAKDMPNGMTEMVMSRLVLPRCIGITTRRARSLVIVRLLCRR